MRDFVLDRQYRASRNTLHVNHTNDFAAYCARQGHVVNFSHPRKSHYEAFRVQDRFAGDGWLIVYLREGAQHYTVPTGLADLVDRYLSDRKVRNL